jgi:DNA helicase-2/ATP-dependent DNA helicase PcrA
MPALDHLNDRQREAVLHGDGPLVVFAGAGSGKTRVITHRIADLVAERGVKPWRILAVTFTNKAAGEMRHRLDALLPGGAGELWAGTFHAISARLLRVYAERAGVAPRFVIYDDQDQKAVLRRIVRDMDLDERRYPPGLVAWRINRAKQEGRAPEDLAVDEEHDTVLRDLCVQYRRRMGDANALDFGDLIYRLVFAMEGDATLRLDLQRRWDHVLVDEFQDVNQVQFSLVNHLCATHRNLCVVGDDDQSIYRWRGADRRNILDFRTHFPDARLVKLEQNYRSTQRILRVANAVVSRNVDRETKTLWTRNEEGAKVVEFACPEDRDEALTVVGAMRALLDAGTARHEIALLYRIHAQSRLFEEALRRFDLPYRVIGGMRFYERAEVKDLLAYLRLVENPDDDVSLLRVINTPPRGIGDRTVERLLESAARLGTSVFRALCASGRELSHAAAARASLGRLRDLIETLRAKSDAGARPSELAEACLAETGYVEALQEEDTPESDSKIENLRELVGSVADFERETPDATLAGFLERVTLESAVDEMDASDAITLMTVHAAKGLEFPIVMVAGMEEELFPHRGTRADDDPDDLEEERRLAYVAFTRARRRLYLSHAAQRRLYGRIEPRQRSRFLDEIPADEIQVVGRTPRAPRASSLAWGAAPGVGAGRFGADGLRVASGAGRRSLHGQRPSETRPWRPAHADSYVDTSEASDLELRLGMRVRHATFGVGEVQGVRPGTPPKVTVVFPGLGPKTILGRFLEPA